MEDKKVKIENVCQNISTQLKNQIMESCTQNDNVIGQLQTAVGEINKFFDEDVQRDIPTGLLSRVIYYKKKILVFHKIYFIKFL